MKYQNSARVPTWIDIFGQTLSLWFETEWKVLLKQRQTIGLRQTLSLWIETEWKVLLKQRQTIGLRQTEKSCLTLHAEPIAWLKVHENEYLRIEH